MKHEHILIIRFSALGDVAMTVPVVWALARQYPHLRITMLSRPMARPFFEGLAPNVNFMSADLKGEYHGIRGLNALFRRLAAKQFTAVADLHNVLRSEYLRLRFNLGRYRVEHIDKHRRRRRKLVTLHSDKRKEQLPTSFQNYLDVLTKLGYPVDTEKYHFRSIFETTDNLSLLPSQIGSKPQGDLSLLPPQIGSRPQGQPWIGIAPFAAHQGKIYPTPLMEKVIEGVLSHRPQAHIFLFGRGQQEDELFPQWVARWPQCCHVGSVLNDMQHELILMSHLDVMLSMDSANMHLASLVGTPVVSVWGATHPYAGFMGWNQHPDNAIGLDMNCRPCSVFGQKPCAKGGYPCLYGIKPETIINKILSF